MMIQVAILFWVLFFVIAFLYLKYVPASHIHLDSLRQENDRRIARKDRVVWEKDHWEGGEYMDTPFGQTHYYILGPKSGPKLVFIHGITAASPCFPQFIQGLADKGYRVLTYDLFGRGFSDAPGVHYNQGLYTSQAYFLVSKLKWERFHLVGLSLGGAIATHFATHFPEMIEELSLIAPAGLLNSLPPIATVLQTPFIGPIFWHALGRNILINISESNYIPEKRTSEVEKCIEMTKYHVQYHPGVMRAYYSTVQHFPVTGMEKDYKKLETLFGDRVAILWVDFALLKIGKTRQGCSI